MGILALKKSTIVALKLYYSLEYLKVTSSRLVYYSILELFGQMSQYICIKFPLCATT